MGCVMWGPKEEAEDFGISAKDIEQPPKPFLE